MGVSNFNDTLPAAPSGKKNVTWQGDDPLDDPRNISAYLELLVGDSGAGGTSGAVPAPAAGDAAANKYLKASGAWATLPATVVAIGDYVDLQTLTNANLTLALTKIITVLEVTTGASDRTVTLPAASTNGKAIVIIKKVDSGAGNVIVARAGSDTIDGATSQTLYFQYTGWIKLFCNSAGTWDVVGYGNRGYDAKAMDIEVNTTEYLVDVVDRNVYYPGNFSGTTGFAITNPADGTYSITVKKNGSSIGTITVTTGGVFTFTTTSGNPFTMVSGDRLSFSPPGSTDSAMAALGVSLKGIC